uniref:Glyoxalase/bleomycin resistance protein/dioxygenase n=1 Tax=uncultured bacterium 59 TaxID=698390 RepID=E3T6H2_9BACT|nr:glyoxalase/bleomycin resistance protein/dioxygenase [uncultured bacterium 59]
MADVDTHVPGAFCWPELATTDQKGAVAFYKTLFGWDLNEQPIGGGETYSMFQMRDRPIGAAYTMRPEERQQGVPPHWGSYVAVKNADDSAKRAQELGGKIVAPAFDVMDSGRMAVIQDPTGAVFCVWQAAKHAGARIIGEPGALCWTELATRDTKAAEKFYTGLFGWTPKHSPPGAGMEYTEFSVGGTPSVGMMPMPEEVPAFVPAHWTPYFMVADVDASAAKAASLGGKLTVPPMDIPNTGRFSMISDPQGAMFAIFAPKK